MWLGLREPGHTALVLVPSAVAGVFSAISTRLARIPRWVQLFTVGCTVTGAAATTTMFGPLVLAPTLLATFTIVLQAHPNTMMRYATWAMGTVALIIIALVELAQPTSYVQIDHAIAILPRMHELPRTGSILLLLFASMAMTIVPCLFIGRIRKALTAAQRQILTQAWQFRRFSEDLIETRQSRPG
jgi:hypothetical protein